MWVTKLLISPVKKKDFLPKNDQIWPKIGIFGQFGPVGGSVGGCGVRAVSRKTPIYFMVKIENLDSESYFSSRNGDKLPTFSFVPYSIWSDK